MSNLVRTIQIEQASNAEVDELVECVMFMRALYKVYPKHLEIAFNAILSETKIPPKLVYPQVGGGVAIGKTPHGTIGSFYNVAPPQEAQE